jgi:RNA polymerase sigma factor (TIGR02999 family)
MSDVTRILSRIQQGDSEAAERLLPLVYDELRALARKKLAREEPGQTLQATALVHEAYLRLVGKNNDQSWENRGHFLAAAAEAMRRILVDIARRKMTVKHGGRWTRENGVRDFAGPGQTPEETIAIDELLERLASGNPRQAEVAKMRLFLGMTLAEISQAMGFSPDTAESDWAYARAWLKRELRRE